MNKEVIPGEQALAIVVLYILGSSLFMGTSGVSGNSVWISILIAMALAVPLMLLYARLNVLLPGKSLFEMLDAVFGRWIGGGLCGLYVWYALHLGALVLRNFGEFTATVALTATPMFVPMLCVGLLCVWVVYAGVEVIGRTAKFLIILSAAGILIVQLLSIPQFEPHYLRPLLDKGWSAVMADVGGTLTFPFGEIVLFLAMFHCLSPKTAVYKTLLGGLGIAGFFIVTVSLRNLLVLGQDIISSLYFPSYVAVSRINIGDFLQRIEGSSAIIFIATLFVKVSVCLYAAASGLAHILRLRSYRYITLQTGLIMVYFAVFVYKDIMEMLYFAYHTYKVYALPFQIILPAALLAGAEIAARSGRLGQKRGG